MALPLRDQTKYWGVAALGFLILLYAMGDVILPFVVSGALAYFLDPVADRLQRAGLSRAAATTARPISGAIASQPTQSRSMPPRRQLSCH